MALLGLLRAVECHLAAGNMPTLNATRFECGRGVSCVDAAIGKGLLTVELIFLDQIGPCFLAPLLSRLILCHFLAQVDQLGALLFQHLFAVGTVSVGAQVSFAFDFSLHEHLFETANLGLLVSDFRW